MFPNSNELKRERKNFKLYLCLLLLNFVCVYVMWMKVKKISSDKLSLENDGFIFHSMWKIGYRNFGTFTWILFCFLRLFNFIFLFWVDVGVLFFSFCLDDFHTLTLGSQFPVSVQCVLLNRLSTLFVFR